MLIKSSNLHHKISKNYERNLQTWNILKIDSVHVSSVLLSDYKREVKGKVG